MVKLQVALDVTDLQKALRLARQAVRGGADVLEAGTILIKQVGMKAVQALTKFGLPVCADIKTMDVGDVETEIAIRAGASIVTIEGWAANETIRKAIRVANKLGAEVMVGTTGRDASYEIVREVCRLKPNYLLKHVGIDIQPKVDVVQAIKAYEIKLLQRYGIGLAIAGGLNPSKIRKLKPYGDVLKICIVGHYITRATNPLKATRQVKQVVEALTE
jgi:3-keto-L-gulonate-6-phosphate decarboxylase